ncbi:MAG: hypothetical protein LUC18_05195, partial [Porphyromonadaceae bacterium]|nr:hypothetical protein [Porphyromonadaceae bacterium]
LNTGFSTSLGSGITLIGGGASLKGLRELLEEETHLEVCRGTLMGVLLPSGVNGAVSMPVIGLLRKGTNVCAASLYAKPSEEEGPVNPDSKRVRSDKTQSSDSNKQSRFTTLWGKVKGMVDEES